MIFINALKIYHISQALNLGKHLYLKKPFNQFRFILVTL